MIDPFLIIKAATIEAPPGGMTRIDIQAMAVAMITVAKISNHNLDDLIRGITAEWDEVKVSIDFDTEGVA